MKTLGRPRSPKKANRVMSAEREGGVKVSFLLKTYKEKRLY